MSQDIYDTHYQYLKRTQQRISDATKLKPLELLVLSIYPATVLLGQLINITSYEVTVNYYTNKRNLLNTIFVKRGWLWTLIILAYFKIQSFLKNPKNTKDLVKFLIRVSIGTLWWVIFTQWFFGVPIMDKVFLHTGGSCKYDLFQASNRGLNVLGPIGSASCRKLRGDWVGGHDPSGHVFLLVHSSLMIWFEVLEVYDANELHQFVESFKTIQATEPSSVKKFQKLVILFFKTSTVVLFLLLVLWWWMLLVTSTHFHSFFEKLTGLVAAYLGVSIYLIPRFLSKNKTD